jgi:hypothetical protein
MRSLISGRQVGEQAVGGVLEQCVVTPAVPELLHHVDEFLGALVALAMAEMLRAPMVARFAVADRSDHVPGRTAAADMVDIGQLPRRSVRRRVGRRHGAPDADMVGHRRQRRQQCQGFGANHRAVLHGVGEVAAVVVVDRQFVGDEQQIEARRFRALGDFLVQPPVDAAAGRRIGMAPAALVGAGSKYSARCIMAWPPCRRWRPGR